MFDALAGKRVVVVKMGGVHAVVGLLRAVDDGFVVVVKDDGRLEYVAVTAIATVYEAK